MFNRERYFYFAKKDAYFICENEQLFGVSPFNDAFDIFQAQDLTGRISRIDDANSSGRAALERLLIGSLELVDTQCPVIILVQVVTNLYV